MTTRTGVRVTTDRVASVLALVKRASRMQVLIGIPYDHTARPGDVGVSNAMIGHINEFGSPTQNIPARPHLVPGVFAARAKSIEILKNGLIAEAMGTPEALDKAMHGAGLTAVSSVKLLIRGRLVPKLADYTIERRLEKGRTGDLPLIDTGQYINAITYVIRRKEDEDAAA